MPDLTYPKNYQNYHKKFVKILSECSVSTISLLSCKKSRDFMTL